MILQLLLKTYDDIVYRAAQSAAIVVQRVAVWGTRSVPMSGGSVDGMRVPFAPLAFRR
jgi:hypothetical protein